jgi:tryptophan synthase alpha chain
MSRIAGRFAALKQAGRKALIPYVTAGDPDPGHTVELMHAMVEAGADIIELGVPFSDPMAEGPVIQHAMERALVHGVTLDDVLDMVVEFRRRDQQTPVLLMGYLNPVEVKGYPAFVEQAKAAGVDGVLLVDLPPEEADALLEPARAGDLDVIFLISPTTSDARIERIGTVCSGFVYYVSLKGVTGAANLDASQVQDRIGHIRGFTGLPIGVGFGIKDAESARSVASVADAVVVGSALVRLVEANLETPEAICGAVGGLVGQMRQAMDS